MICFLSLQVDWHYLKLQTNYITHQCDFISNVSCSSDYSFNVNAFRFSLTFCFLTVIVFFSCCCHKKQLQSLNYGSRVQFVMAGRPRQLSASHPQPGNRVMNAYCYSAPFSMCPVQDPMWDAAAYSSQDDTPQACPEAHSSPR